MQCEKTGLMNSGPKIVAVEHLTTVKANSGVLNEKVKTNFINFSWASLVPGCRV